MAQTLDTKDRLLDAAEALFAQHGYGASLRGITAAAGANLAAVNYHFGSKEELLLAVVRRRVDDVNGARLAALDALEARAAAPTLEEVMEVFVRPALELASGGVGHANFLRLMMRIHADTQGPWRRLLAEGVFEAVQRRFSAAFARLLPDLSDEGLLWRLHLVVGAMVHAILHADTLSTLSGGRCDASDPEAALRQLVPFLAGGLAARGPSPS